MARHGAARDLLKTTRAQDGEFLDLDFLDASVHGLDADFPAARSALERINRATPSRPEVLTRLVQVCEQMRDYPAAVGYLKHALRVSKGSTELETKRSLYESIRKW